jgi:hypothetical protein
METIPREQIPEDFTYYRTASQVFYEFYRDTNKKIRVILLQDIPSVASHKESFEFIGLNQLF